jgi:hypothetical protein
MLSMAGGRTAGERDSVRPVCGGYVQREGRPVSGGGFNGVLWFVFGKGRGEALAGLERRKNKNPKNMRGGGWLREDEVSFLGFPSGLFFYPFLPNFFSLNSPPSCVDLYL